MSNSTLKRLRELYFALKKRAGKVCRCSEKLYLSQNLETNGR